MRAAGPPDGPSSSALRPLVLVGLVGALALSACSSPSGTTTSTHTASGQTGSTAASGPSRHDVTTTTTAPPGPVTFTLTSASGTGPQTTPTFVVPPPAARSLGPTYTISPTWTVSASYNCAAEPPSISGYVHVEVFSEVPGGPPRPLYPEVVTDTGRSGSSFEKYPYTGSFYLSVSSAVCPWSVTASVVDDPVGT